jgi:hypothetical protein
MSEELEMNTEGADSDQAEAYLDMFYAEEEVEYLENRCVQLETYAWHGVN